MPTARKISQTLRLLAALCVAVTTTSAIAGETVKVPERMLEKFLVGGASSGTAEAALDRAAADAAVERPSAALDGTQYAVIAPTFTGSDGNISYVRLANRQGMGGSTSKTTTFNVTVTGSPSGQVYGVAHIDVPPLASPQYAISEILTKANAGPLAAGDTGYALYLQDSDAVSYQHVIYNAANGFFEDASICDAGGYAGESGSRATLLMNVHTSLLADYPSQVFIHNFHDGAAAYQVTVADAKTGAIVGKVDLSTAAHASYSLPETFFEEALKWSPTANQAHANLIFEDLASPQSVNALVGQFIFNQRLSAYVNMSVGCNVAIASASTAATTFGGTVAGNGLGGTLTVSVDTATVAAASSREKSRALDTPPAGAQEASGVLLISGQSSIALTGAADPQTNQVTLTGGGYKLEGSIDETGFSGTYTAPGGGGGGFSTLKGTKDSVTTFCGTYTGTNEIGVFNLQVDASGNASGVTAVINGQGLARTLSGRLSAGALSGSGVPFNGTPGRNMTFTGRVESGSLQGNYQVADGTVGTFTGTGCQQPNSSVQFAGTVAGPGGESGTYSVSVEGRRASGTLMLLGQPTIALTGTYDSVANTISIGGGGISFTGVVKGEVYAGTYNSPTINGGQFSTLNASQFSVTPYCGSFAGPLSGVWNVQVASNGGVSGEFNGTLVAGSILGQIAGTTISGTAHTEGGDGTFSGSVQVGSTSGTYRFALGGGTFQGTACELPH